MYNDENDGLFDVQVKMPKRPNKKGMVLDVDPLWAVENQGEEVVMEDAMAQEVKTRRALLMHFIYSYSCTVVVFWCCGMCLFGCLFFFFIGVGGRW